MTRNDEATAALFEVVQALVNDPDIRGRWDSLAMVLETNGSSASAHGYRYRGDEAEPVSPSSIELFFTVLPRFWKATSRPTPWKTCLVQVVKPSLSFEVTFEHKNARRWQVTPRNVDEMPGLLRPDKAAIEKGFTGKAATAPKPKAAKPAKRAKAKPRAARR